MSSRDSGPAVVVGIDGSRAALHAALWAIDEAVTRDVPLRLVYVIESPPVSGGIAGHQAAARAALFDAQQAIKATGKEVVVDTEILWGRPLTKLMQESRSASMICVGSIGRNHAHSGQGSVAGALAGSSLCPVAVIHRSPDGTTVPTIRRVVAEADNGAVLRHAFQEARLRGVPLRAVSVQETHAQAGDGNRLAKAQLDRRLTRWTRLYPDVRVESAIVRGHGGRYMADNEGPGQLFVTDAHAAQVRSVYNAGSSVLTVRSGNL
ncbi:MULTISPECIES: universal stress protein [unclassified Mycobacterium]|uniref:universal stress protein n=1 Tax=unclassified Mycobacterium TaxID=2642494 RepID=UPI000FC2852F|nr:MULTISPECIES: universal stress protein [unclassified Mycobacterium]MDP7703388.1 universal stress protein [Mycobacterium sp. TY815]MDP7721871.1 universal stress protein [Mycobacterium sp. TY814]RUP02602.1 MAG: universal stress protein [Mycobacterium sp.]